MINNQFLVTAAGASRRRVAKFAVVVLAVAAFAAAGLSGALAQDDSIFGDDWPFPSGGSGGSGIFGDDWPFPTGGSGGAGDINVGGTSGSNITMGSGGGGISIGGGSSGGSGSNSGSGGGYDYP